MLLALAVALAASAAHAQPLSPAELGTLARFDGERGFAGMPRQFRAQEAPRVESAYAAARAEFSGKGARIAEHYLRHTGTPPGAGAYFFVLEAVADAEAAFALIRGLVEPPMPESGPEFESGGKRQRLPRYEGEVEGALEAVLASDTVARDPRVAQALKDAIATLRAKPRGIARGPAARAVALLGRLDSDEARDALRQLAADPDAEIRGLALAALGSAGLKADSGLLARTLLEDAAPRAIAQLQAREALPALRRSLAEERHPEVVDAVVQALAALKALPDDPRQCFDAAARSWDAQPASLAFGCWRAQAGRDALLQAAAEGPNVVRVLAMAALFERPAARDLPLLQFPPQNIPPPPAFNNPTRKRLLESSVEVLSRAARAYPDRPDAISHSVAYQLNALLFDLAAGDMRLALDYADRIVTPGARSVNDGRFAASNALWRSDARAYEAQRRPRQALLAAAIAACALLLLIFPATRIAALAAALPIAAWAAWSLTTGGVRELPPLALAPFTIAGSASLVAGFTAGATVLWRERRQGTGWAGAMLLGGGAIGAAAVTAFFVCGAARWYDVFPIMLEGWELIFDPIGAAVVAASLTVLGLAAAAGVRRFSSPRSDKDFH